MRFRRRIALATPVQTAASQALVWPAWQEQGRGAELGVLCAARAQSEPADRPPGVALATRRPVWVWACGHGSPRPHASAVSTGAPNSAGSAVIAAVTAEVRTTVVVAGLRVRRQHSLRENPELNELEILSF
jgi:hypothetical protein